MLLDWRCLKLRGMLHKRNYQHCINIAPIYWNDFARPLHEHFLPVHPKLNQEDNNTDSCVLRLSSLTSLLCSYNRYPRQFCYKSWALVENTSFSTKSQRTALFIVRVKHMLVKHFCMEIRFPEIAAFLPDKVGCVSRNNYSKIITLE